jgi:hypothetical protein
MTIAEPREDAMLSFDDLEKRFNKAIEQLPRAQQLDIQRYVNAMVQDTAKHIKKQQRANTTQRRQEFAFARTSNRVDGPKSR